MPRHHSLTHGNVSLEPHISDQPRYLLLPLRWERISKSPDLDDIDPRFLDLYTTQKEIIYGLVFRSWGNE